MHRKERILRQALKRRVVPDDIARGAPGPAAEFVWADEDFLVAQGVAPWSDLPVWVPGRGDTAGFARVSISRAVAAGLTFRPLATTVADTLAWFGTLPEDRRAKLRAGLSAEREAEVLKAWHARAG